MGLFTESLYKECQSIIYMWLSLKCVNKQHCPHCALPLSFISVLFWYVFIIISIPESEALGLNYSYINYFMPVFAFALAQTAKTYNYSFKWIETFRPQWSGIQHQVHSNCVCVCVSLSLSLYIYIYMLVGYQKCSFIMGVYKTDMFFYVSCLVMLYLIWHLSAHVSEIKYMLCYICTYIEIYRWPAKLVIIFNFRVSTALQGPFSVSCSE